MRLDKIKIAGFKSFVDPTIISFPGSLVGVVGPNGCGKSNVIDATRWVMGEASAKYLRGDTKTDVIFNGSNARKPVGKASVELFFDNGDGTLGGEYANYSEIAIRRELTRDGKSQYYLNGTKCRRRDITDIFLGTGLGPRSYAIIEQGTISRMIEAKPEELRVYLEEAAGISKYKDRRRETENRIRHTRDNLERLDDVRDELGKQLRRLDHQAKTAEKYQAFKTEEKQLKAELFTLRWRDLDGELNQADIQLGTQDNQVEAAVALQRKVEADIEEQRNVFTQRNDALNEVQAQFYRLGSDIARLEQTIQHQKETQQNQTRERQQLEYNLQEIAGHLGRDNTEIESLSAALMELEPALERAKSQQEEAKAVLDNCEAAQRDQQTAWDNVQLELSTLKQTTEVERTRIAGLDNNQQQLLNRRERLQSELDSYDATELAEQQASAQERLETLTQQLESSQEQLTEQRDSLQRQREGLRESAEQLNQQRSQLRQAEGRAASLEALQQAALGLEQGQSKHQSTLQTWLAEHNLHNQPRLAQQLEVAAGWETAVETVLGDFVEAIVLPEHADVGDMTHFAVDRQSLHLRLVANTTVHTASNYTLPNHTLLSKVENAAGASSVLANVLVADDLSAAMARLDDLQAGQSIITSNGVWLGQGWARLPANNDAQGSVLMREQLLRECHAELEVLSTSVDTLDQQRAVAEQGIRQQEQQYSETQQNHNQLVQQHARADSDNTRLQNQIQQLQTRQAALQQDLRDIDERLSNDTDKLKTARQTLETAIAALDDTQIRQAVLLEQRTASQATLQQMREAAAVATQNAHNLALQIETRKSSHASKRSNLERLHEQQTQMQERLIILMESLDVDDDPIAEQQVELEEKMAARVTVEAALAEARSLTAATEHQQRELAASRQQAENKVQQLREQAEGARLQRQEVAVRRQTITEQLAEMGVSVDSILPNLDTAANTDTWDEKLAQVQRRIERLGPINLAAIDEHEQQAERKTHLDAQNDDLRKALDELEAAIKEIDRETRTRFTDTFDRVNAGLGRIFPRMFGGGHAKLAKTEDDALSAGIMIQAQPPGKRNSSISQLSGGEKALTAAALVFAIFELNPAPFCMLDEVDAPLDDANASRLAEQIREMSKTVQFVFITHNKITMDLAEQLCGVTMREPGVSRLVAVDVDEAMKLAG